MRVLPPPGPERTRQVTRLVVLLGLLAVVLWWVWTPAAPPAPAAKQPTPGASRPAEAQLPVPDPLRLGALEAPAEPEDVARNPFVFGERDAPPAGEPFVFSPPPSETPAVEAPPVPQGPPPVPLQLTGLTVLEAGGRTLVTLKDPSTNVLYQAYEGDIVDGRYRVVKVGVQSVVVSYLDGSGMRTLPLGG